MVRAGRRATVILLTLVMIATSLVSFVSVVQERALAQHSLDPIMVDSDRQDGYSLTTLYEVPEFRDFTIDGAGAVGSDTAIAVDSMNRVHISYTDSTNGCLKYATNAAGTWETCVIDDDCYGIRSSIAIDSNGNAHVSYCDCTNYTATQISSLKYATNADGVWTSQVLDEGYAVGWDTSIAVDSNDGIHISYWNCGVVYDLMYATNAGGAWQKYTIDDEGYTGAHSSIAVDSMDYVHISYVSDIPPYDGDIKYATNTGGTWSTSTVCSANETFSTSIAVGASDNVHVSYLSRPYSHPTYSTLMYATNELGTWNSSEIDSAGDVCSFTSIAADSGNGAHISYMGDDYTLKYATNRGGTWSNCSVDNCGITASVFSSIALDSEDQVHISYYDSANADLKYATDIVLVPRAPIYIDGNANFTTVNGVSGGSGTESDPYVIEGWAIATDTSPCIDIRNTDAYFVIRSVSVQSSLHEYYDGGAIRLESVANGVIRDCELFNSTFGAMLRSSTTIFIEHNSFWDNVNRDVWLYESSYISINGNQFLDRNSSSHGIGIWSDVPLESHFNTHEISTDNILNGQPVYYFKNEVGLSLDSAVLGQLIIASCDDVSLSRVQTSETPCPIRMCFSDNIVLRDTSLSGDVLFLACSNVLAERNHLTECSYGLYPAWSQAVTFRQNVIDNGTIGMEISTVSDVEILDNTISNCSWDGIRVFDASSIIMSGNEITNCGTAISFNNASGVVVERNAFGSSTYYGISYNSLTANLYHNSFIDNAVNVNHRSPDDVWPSQTTWDDGYPSGGNYWSDYTGVDQYSGPNQDQPGSDGIGDTPYVIDSDSQDRYPLMEPYSENPPSSWYGEPSFAVSSLTLSVSAEIGIGWVTLSYQLSLGVHLILPEMGVSQTVFAQKIQDYFGYELTSDSIQSAFIVLSVGGFRPCIAAINDAYNLTLSWLYGPLTIIDHVGFLFNSTGCFTAFGFVETYSPQSEDLMSLVLSWVSSLLSIFKEDPLALFEVMLVALETVTDFLNIGAGVLVPGTSDSFSVLADWSLVKTYDLLRIAGNMLFSYEKVLKFVLEIGKAGATAATVVGAVFHGFMAVVRAVDLALMWLAPDNPISDLLSYLLSIVDPENTTIYPAVEEGGGHILGYSPANGSMLWSAEGVGFVLGGICNDDYYWQVFLSEEYFESEYALYCVGNESISVPYMLSLAPNGTAPSATASGTLNGSQSVVFKMVSVNDTYILGAVPTAGISVSNQVGNLDTVFEFDATMCYDSEDTLELLEVRWDFDGDGEWDTDWSTEKVAYHQYDVPSEYTVLLEVRDTSGLTNTTSIQVVVIEAIPEFSTVIVPVLSLLILMLLVVRGRQRRDKPKKPG